MKKFLYTVFVCTIIFGCTEKYDLDTSFSAPINISGPTSIVLEVTSTDKIVFSWEGAAANDGSYLLCDVMFDKEGGDFSSPLYVQNADLGGGNTLSLSHSQLNIIARYAGILPEQTGTLKWTVRVSKGGDSKIFAPASQISVTRSAGISVIPDNLYLYGSATENGGQGGQEFRRASDGVFEIYTTLPQDGVIYFRNSTTEEATNYYMSGGKLMEAEGDTPMEAYSIPKKITVNFNDLSMSISDEVVQIKMIWAASWLDVDPEHVDFMYESNGVFRLSDCTLTVPFTHPGWGGQMVSDARYYFQTLFGQDWVHWRRMSNVSDQEPAANESLGFFEVDTTCPWAGEQWTGAWKLRSALFNKTCDVVIYTNKQGMVVHQFENVH